jgi:glucose/arabinose dehydrogenase
VAVSPDFAEDQLLYLYVSTAEDNRVVRATLDDNDRLGAPQVVLDGIPNGFIHDGGRLAFGPDGFLYVSTGETGVGELSQDPASLAGKILRITPDGDPAPGNPDPDSPVWSLGHRNVQGLAFDDQESLWASEFGASTYDELNLIRPGSNYGWPEVEGRGGSSSFVNPRVVWSTDEASPSGLAYADGRLWLAALRGTRLWRIDVDGGEVGAVRDFFVGDYGRLRTVAVAPDGMLWVTTSNRDGRGDPAETDDRILVVDPG